jgi:hypothetical protein
MVWSLHCALQKVSLGGFTHMDIMTVASSVGMEEQQMYCGSVAHKGILNVAHKGYVMNHI